MVHVFTSPKQPPRSQHHVITFSSLLAHLKACYICSCVLQVWPLWNTQWVQIIWPSSLWLPEFTDSCLWKNIACFHGITLTVVWMLSYSTVGNMLAHNTLQLDSILYEISTNSFPLLKSMLPHPLFAVETADCLIHSFDLYANNIRNLWMSFYDNCCFVL